MHPLKLWQSEKVKILLEDFYKANLEFGGIDKFHAEKIINLAWDARNKPENAIKVSMHLISKIFERVKLKQINAPKEINIIDLFDYSNVKSYLDVGANKLNTINYLMTTQPKIQKFFAIDIIPRNRNFIDDSRGKYFQVPIDSSTFPIEDDSIDFINIQFVLHHFQDLESIKKTLQNCYRALKQSGTLGLWEETFTQEFDIPKLTQENSKVGILTDPWLTKRFYELTEDERWQFVIVNDWIINVKNLHMPWTNQYRTWEDWIKLFEENGFKLKKDYNLGLRVNGRFKQGAHIMGEFIRK